MSVPHRVYAALAKLVYDAPGKREYAGWAEDSALSSQEATVQVNTANPSQVVIAYRGTKSFKDVGTDVLLGLSLHKISPRFKHSVELARRVLHKYPGATVTVTGHSLGGALATHVSKTLHVPAVVFNPGTTVLPWKLAQQKRECSKPNPPAHCDKLTTYRVEKDPVSVFSGQYGQHITLPGEGSLLNRHSSQNFVDKIKRVLFGPPKRASRAAISKPRRQRRR